HDELFARLLVAERADVGLILLRGRFGHRCLLRSDGGTVVDPLRCADPGLLGFGAVSAATRASAPGLGTVGPSVVGPGTIIAGTVRCRTVGFGRGLGDLGIEAALSDP